MAGAATSRSWIVPATALFLSAFAICTAEFIVAGLLPAIGDDLKVDIPTAGLLISGYALAVAITGPVFALLTGSLPRRPLLLLITGIFVVGNILCALAATYWMLLGARVLVACCHGLFFGIAFVLAMRLAPKDRQTSAVSLVIAGVSLASVLGVPIGTAIGQAYGWRTTFWVIACAGTLAAVAVGLLVPDMPEPRGRKSDLAAEVRAAIRPTVLLGYCALAFFIMGALGLYSYLVPLLTTVGGLPPTYVPVVLFGMGFCGVFGNMIGGWLADRRPFVTMIAILATMVVIMLALAVLADSATGAVICLLLCWCVGYGFPAPIQAYILKEARGAPTLAATLSSTATHLGIAIAAALGAAAISAGWSYGSLPLVAAACEFVALTIVIILAFFGRRRPGGETDHV